MFPRQPDYSYERLSRFVLANIPFSEVEIVRQPSLDRFFYVLVYLVIDEAQHAFANATFPVHDPPAAFSAHSTSVATGGPYG